MAFKGNFSVTMFSFIFITLDKYSSVRNNDRKFYWIIFLVSDFFLAQFYCVNSDSGSNVSSQERDLLFYGRNQKS